MTIPIQSLCHINSSWWGSGKSSSVIAQGPVNVSRFHQRMLIVDIERLTTSICFLEFYYFATVSNDEVTLWKILQGWELDVSSEHSLVSRESKIAHHCSRSWRSEVWPCSRVAQHASCNLSCNCNSCTICKHLPVRWTLWRQNLSFCFIGLRVNASARHMQYTYSPSQFSTVSSSAFAPDAYDTPPPRMLLMRWMRCMIESNRQRQSLNPQHGIAVSNPGLSLSSIK